MAESRPPRADRIFGGSYFASRSEVPIGNGVNQGDAPIYTARGARPRPTQSGGAASKAWRAPIILAAAMVGWMLFVLILAAIAAPAGTGRETKLQIGTGVTVTVPGGWTAAADVWQLGTNAVSIRKSGVLVALAAETYHATDQNLLADMSSRIEAQFDSYRALPAASTTIGGDLPGLVVLFSGTARSGLLEGELVVGARGGRGVVMLAVAPEGQLRRVQGDLDRMLGSIDVPR